MRWIKNWLLPLALLASAASAMSASEHDQIVALMKQTWDSPLSPLDVSPVTIEDNHAIAGWVQGERGGRALLGRMNGKWRVVLCAGDGLLDIALLRDAGLSQKQAEALVLKTTRAEAELPKERVGKFALFKGALKVDAHHGHEEEKH